METPENNLANEDLAPQDNTRVPNAANEDFRNEENKNIDPLSSSNDSQNGKMSFDFENKNEGPEHADGTNESNNAPGNFRNRFADEAEAGLLGNQKRLGDSSNLNSSGDNDYNKGRQNPSALDNSQVRNGSEQYDPSSDNEASRNNEDQGNYTPETPSQNSGIGDFRSQQEDDNTQQSLRSRQQELGGEEKRNNDKNEEEYYSDTFDKSTNL